MLDRHAGIHPPRADRPDGGAARRTTRRPDPAATRRFARSSPFGDGVAIHTDAGTERFDAAVVTVGPWVNDLLPDLPWEVDIRRLISAWYVPTTEPGTARSGRPSSAPHPPTATACPRRTASRSSSACPAHCTSRWVIPISWNAPSTPEELEIFTELLGRYLPDLHPDPIRLSVFMEGYTESSRPLVGPLPG